MSTKRRVLSALSLLVGLVLASCVKFVWLRSHAPARESMAMAGRKLPSLKVADDQGRLVDLSSALRGRRSVIAFYSASCDACRVVLPELRPFPPSLALFLVNEEDPRESGQASALGFGQAEWFYDRDSVFSRSFPMSRVPTILFVDEEGVLRGGLVGAQSRDRVQNRIREFAEEGL